MSLFLAIFVLVKVIFGFSLLLKKSGPFRWSSRLLLFVCRLSTGIVSETLPASGFAGSSETSPAIESNPPWNHVVFAGGDSDRGVGRQGQGGEEDGKDQDGFHGWSSDRRIWAGWFGAGGRRGYGTPNGRPQDHDSPREEVG